MNIFEVQGKPNIGRGKSNREFALLTGDDRRFRKAKEEELAGRIPKRTSPAKQEPISKRVTSELAHEPSEENDASNNP